MKSFVTKGFWKHFAGLPQRVQAQARKNYELWRDDHYHNGLQFKRVSQRQSIYSVRVNDDYRALGLLENEAIYWFWIGPHGDYDKLLRRL